MGFLFGLSKWSCVEIGRANAGGEPRIGVGDDMGFGTCGNGKVRGLVFKQERLGLGSGDGIRIVQLEFG